MSDAAYIYPTTLADALGEIVKLRGKAAELEKQLEAATGPDLVEGEKTAGVDDVSPDLGAFVFEKATEKRLPPFHHILVTPTGSWGGKRRHPERQVRARSSHHQHAHVSIKLQSPLRSPPTAAGVASQPPERI